MYVCICKAVTDSEIRDAVVRGADSVEAIGQELQAGTRCGACTDCVFNLVATTRAAMNAGGGGFNAGAHSRAVMGCEDA